MRMQGKVAVITGGGSGIGKRAAERFVEEGGRVVIADFHAERAARVVEQLGSAACFAPCDVNREADIAAAIGLAESTWGRLDLMFNNAGAGGDPSPIESMSVEGWDTTMHLLVRSVMLGIKHATPVMRRQGSGSIVSTASVAGLVPGSTAVAYNVAKSAVIHLTKCAALDLAQDRIRVNCICPGVIGTAIFARNHDFPSQATERMVADLAAAQERFQPLPRAGRPDDIADGVLWLSDDRAGFVTGIALPIDGGFAAGIGPEHRKAIWQEIRSVATAAVETAEATVTRQR